MLLGWLFERANRSMAVAIAAHMGAHIDKFDRAPRHDLRLQIVHLFVVAGIAVVAGGSLARRARPSPSQDGYGKPGAGARRLDVVEPRRSSCRWPSGVSVRTSAMRAPQTMSFAK